jgi:hypothetical protein
MPNPSTPNGLTPVRPMNAFSTSTNQYSVLASDGTLIGIGDLVKLAGTSQTINDATYPDVVRAATGDVFVGAVTSVLPVTRDSTIYREASTQRILVVCDDPNVLFEVQESAAGTALTINDIGLNANIVVASASTVTGLSATTLDNSTEATTNTLDLKIVGLANKPNNAVGESAKWIVRINRHQYSNQVIGT